MSDIGVAKYTGSPMIAVGVEVTEVVVLRGTEVFTVTLPEPPESKNKDEATDKEG